MTQQLVLEGTWEEVARHSAEFAGRKVRLTVLPPAQKPQPDPPFSTSEFPAPIDLPRPGRGLKVDFSRSKVRLPGPFLAD